MTNSKKRFSYYTPEKTITPSDNTPQMEDTDSPPIDDALVSTPPTDDVGPTPVLVPTINKLMKLLRPIESEYYIIGLELGISRSKLSQLHVYGTSGNYQCLEIVLKEWKDGPHKDTSLKHKPYTWETVINVLNSKQINKNNLAEKAKKYYMS